MDNENQITKSISNTIYGTADVSSIPMDVTESGGVLDKIKNISWMTWVLIIFILAFLGFNIFSYLAQGTKEVTNIFSPIVDNVTKLFGGVTTQVIDVGAEGAKGVVTTASNVSQAAIGTTANVVNKGLTTVQDITPQGAAAKGTVKGEQIQQEDIARANALNKALNRSVNQTASKNDYQPDDAMSSIQSGPQKAGWCYIGEERGYRTCAEVGVNDTCMSGDIFPNQEICINPRLRA